MKNEYVGWTEVSQFLMNDAGLPKSVTLKAYTKSDRYNYMQQILTPMKGTFAQVKTKSDYKKLMTSYKLLQNKIMKRVSQRASRVPAYKGLYIFENFQLSQKGPVHDVTPDMILESVNKIVDNGNEVNLTDEVKRELVEASKLLKSQLIQEGLLNCVKSADIRPVEAWMSMKGSSVRGVPVMVPGNKIITYTDQSGKKIETTVDQLVCDRYGDDMDSIISVLRQMKVIVQTIGLRLQGLPEPEPTKVRIINMPEVPQQYALRAIQKPIQEYLKQRSELGYAWQEPEVYWKNMARAMSGQNEEFYYFSLDYSKFDSRCSLFVRQLAFDVLCDVCLDKAIPWKRELIDIIKYLWGYQYLLGPNKSKSVSAYHVPNLLASGSVLTQLLGNVVNRLYQYYFSLKLGYRLPWDRGLCAGDDTALPVPKTLVDKLGYVKYLKVMAELVERLGGKMNEQKQYPVIFETIFLQRAYNYPVGIIGEYSLIRALASLVFAENPRMAVPGVDNLDALEVIGQLSVLNLILQSQGKVTNKDILATEIIPWWLTWDKALSGLIGECLTKAKGNSALAGSLMFTYLILASGGKQSVKDALNLETYDKYKLNSVLETRDALEKSLPILSLICEVGSNMKLNTYDYRKVFECKTPINSALLQDFYAR